MIPAKRKVIACAAWLTSLLPRQQGARIVTYHGVSAHAPGKYDTTAQVFEEHLLFLRDAGYRTVHVSQLVDCQSWMLSNGKTLAITFDDGLANNFDIAADLLTKYGMTGTFFIPSAFIREERSTGWLSNIMMSWSDLRSLQAAGFEIGSHTRTHPNLGACALDVAREEIAGSKQDLEDRLGREIRSFAYPYGGPGAHSQQTRQLAVAAGYKAVCTQTPGPVTAHSDPLRLPRSGTRGTDTVKTLKMRLDGGYDFVRWIHCLQS